MERACAIQKKYKETLHKSEALLYSFTKQRQTELARSLVCSSSLPDSILHFEDRTIYCLVCFCGASSVGKAHWLKEKQLKGTLTRD